jgi:hypothetical protein
MTPAMFALHEIYGEVPIGYHIANVALGGLVVCLLHAVTIRWTGNSLIAWLAACIFGLASDPFGGDCVDHGYHRSRRDSLCLAGVLAIPGPPECGRTGFP